MQSLAAEGENVLEMYENMSESEWDSYALKKTLEYYD